MAPAATFLPLAVLLPLGAAAALLMLSHWLPPRSADMAATIVSLLLAVLCGWLAWRGLDQPIVHWFAGWNPASAGRPDVRLGISFAADAPSAAVSAFYALLFAASFVFSWGYFDKVHAHFHVLMLLFLAAMIGFCLTRDLFNLFVWFELMSIAAFALTAYPLRESSLEGALNFIVTNTIASFSMLMGIGILYARTGTLDFALMAHAIAGHDGALAAGGFCLLAVALMTKAAIVPFHFWLSDAHAVAPSPVSVIFSGAMVSAGCFGLFKIVIGIFPLDRAVVAFVHDGLPWFGIVTAILGGLTAWAQRHLKRLLAFSTIAHLGIVLIGVATLTPAGEAGMLLYIGGHGLIKAALFMIAGILLARFNSCDEITLYGRGRSLWPAGLAMAVGALLLANAPVGLLYRAGDVIDHAIGWRTASVAAVLSSALTGGALLRAAARIFLGCSGAPGPERNAPTEREREKSDRPLWLMLLPCCLLLALALLPADLLEPFLRRAARTLLASSNMDAAATAALRQTLPASAFLAPGLAVGLAFLSLMRRRPVSRIARAAARLEMLPFRGLDILHSGFVTDYVVWMALGLGAIAMVFSLT
ncbi:MAG TPA: proton-conducting transporter membrane subunit [Rhizobiaceae bacterium]|nr:proton-conducting transporter membrane subunit [Rhizobiaceae bacterium]